MKEERDNNIQSDELVQITQEIGELKDKFEQMMALLKNEDSVGDKDATAPVKEKESLKKEQSLKEKIHYLFSNDPPLLSAARTTIRITIEDYCKFVKGFDMGDLFLPDKAKRTTKFKLAGIDPDRIKTLNEIYEEGNTGAHSDNTEFMSADKIQSAKEAILAHVTQLELWGMDKVDKTKGRLHFCRSQDARLKSLLDSGEADTIPNFDQKLAWHFHNMEEFMKNYQINASEVADIQFKRKEDAEQYWLEKKVQKGGTKLSAEEEALALSIYERRANEGDFDACLWMGNHYRLTKNTLKAVAYYTKAMAAQDADDKIQNTAPTARVNAGYTLYYAKEYSAAAKWFDHIPNNDTAAIFAGDCYLFEQKEEQALRSYRLVGNISLLEDKRKRFIANRINVTEPRVALGYYTQCTNATSDPELCKQIGDCYLVIGEVSKAIASYLAALTAQPSSETKRSIAETLAAPAIHRALFSEYRGSNYAKTIADLFWNCQMETLAMTWYETYTKTHSDASVFEKMGTYYLRHIRENGENTKDVTNAVNCFERCASSVSRNFEVVSFMINYYHNTSHHTQHAYWSRAMEQRLNTLPNIFFADTIPYYEKCQKSALSPKTQKSVGDYHFTTGATETAVKWYAAYCLAKPDYAFALKTADSIWEKNKHESAMKLYEIHAEKTQNTAVAKRLAEYYESKGKLSDAVKWYEKHYHFRETDDKKDIAHIIRLHEQCNHPYEVLEWKKKLGDVFFNEGNKEDACALYIEYNQKRSDKTVAFRLAEYYYFKEMYQEAVEQLKIHTAKDVLMHKGFALAVNGPLFIACNNCLIPVEHRMIQTVKIKRKLHPGKRSAVLYLNNRAPNVLSRTIKLFDSLPADDVIVETLRNMFIPPKAKKQKSHKPLKKVFGNPLVATGAGLMLLVAAIAIFIELSFTLYHKGGIFSDVAWYLPDEESIRYWLYVGGIPFVINTLIARYVCQKSILSTIIPWATLFVQYIINLLYQRWIWLDPNDGELYWGEFIWEAIARPVFYGVLFALVFYIIMKKLPKNK